MRAFGRVPPDGAGGILPAPRNVLRIQPRRRAFAVRDVGHGAADFAAFEVRNQPRQPKPVSFVSMISKRDVRRTQTTRARWATPTSTRTRELTRKHRPNAQRPRRFAFGRPDAGELPGPVVAHYLGGNRARVPVVVCCGHDQLTHT
jgi:hypothetical protein